MTTVDAAALKVALKDALNFADRHAREFGVVRLRTTDTHLVVSATDRYVFARLRVPARDPEPMDVCVGYDDIKTLVLPLLSTGSVSLTRKADRVLLGVFTATLPLLTTEPPLVLVRGEQKLFSFSFDEEGASMAAFTIDLLRKLPRRDGARSQAHMFHVGKSTVWFDASPERRWVVLVAPARVPDNPADAFFDHNNTWKDLS